MSKSRELFFAEIKSAFETCVNEHPEIKGVALAGGYGRGEGAMFCYDEGWRLYNDIDIVLLVDEYDFDLVESKAADLKETLSSIAGVSSIDFDLRTVNSLKKLKPSVYNYDLKYGSCIIKGEEYFQGLPSYRPDALQDREIYTLFITRLYCLVSSAKEITSIEDERYANYQLAKACLAVCDAIILKRRLYHHSYRERIKIVEKVSELSLKEQKCLSWALNFKLEPSAEKFWQGDLNEFHKFVCEMYIRIMLDCLGSYFLFRPNSIIQLPAAILSKPYELLKIVVTLFGRQKKYFYRYLLVMAQAHLVNSYSLGERDFVKSYSYLRRIPDAKLENESKVLKTIYDARMVYY